MSKLLLLLLPFWLGPLLAQPTAEEKVLQSVQQMMANDDGTVIFSELYNDDRFNSEEKAFLGRLYEIFFQIPLIVFKLAVPGCDQRNGFSITATKCHRL